MSDVAEPLVCHRCWPKQAVHYKPCEHAMYVFAQGRISGEKETTTLKTENAELRDRIRELEMQNGNLRKCAESSERKALEYRKELAKAQQVAYMHEPYCEETSYRQWIKYHAEQHLCLREAGEILEDGVFLFHLNDEEMPWCVDDKYPIGLEVKAIYGPIELPGGGE